MAGVDGLVFGIFVLGLVLVALRVGYLWRGSAETLPTPGRDRRSPSGRFYALAGIAAGIGAAIATDFHYGVSLQPWPFS